MLSDFQTVKRVKNQEGCLLNIDDSTCQSASSAARGLEGGPVSWLRVCCRLCPVVAVPLASFYPVSFSLNFGVRSPEDVMPWVWRGPCHMRVPTIKAELIHPSLPKCPCEWHGECLLLRRRHQLFFRRKLVFFKSKLIVYTLHHCWGCSRNCYEFPSSAV